MLSCKPINLHYSSFFNLTYIRFNIGLVYVLIKLIHISGPATRRSPLWPGALNLAGYILGKYLSTKPNLCHLIRELSFSSFPLPEKVGPRTGSPSKEILRLPANHALLPPSARYKAAPGQIIPEESVLLGRR